MLTRAAAAAATALLKLMEEIQHTTMMKTKVVFNAFNSNLIVAVIGSLTSEFARWEICSFLAGARLFLRCASLCSPVR